MESPRATDLPSATSVQNFAAIPARQQMSALRFVWRNPWIRALSYVLIIASLLYTLISLRQGYSFALQVAIIGFVIAYILNPLVNGLQKLRVSRAFAVIVVYVLLAQLLLFGSLLFAQVINQLGEFVGLIPQAVDNATPFIKNISNFLGSWQSMLPEFLTNRLGIENTLENGIASSIADGADGNVAVSATNDASTVTPEVNPLVSQLQNTLTNLATNITEGIMGAGQQVLQRTPTFFLSGVTNVISITLQVFLALLASGYFLYDYPKFTASFYRHLPTRYRSFAKDLSHKADRAMGGYLRGQLLITTMLGGLIWLGLSLIGVPLALAISFLAAIFNLVPYLGPIIGVIPAVLLGLTVSPATAVLAVVVFAVANQLEGNVLAPLILSRSTDLHPVTVLLGILAGAGMFGLLGALLAVPVIAFAKVLLEEYVLTRPEFTEENG